jgi:hypothetical protein
VLARQRLQGRVAFERGRGAGCSSRGH